MLQPACLLHYEQEQANHSPWTSKRHMNTQMIVSGNLSPIVKVKEKDTIHSQRGFGHMTLNQSEHPITGFHYLLAIAATNMPVYM